MTVSSTTSRVVHSGNGVTVLWPFAFKVDSAADLVVIFTDSTDVDNLLSSSAYTATGFGLDAGGTVTYPLSGSPIAAGTRLTILRAVEVTQPAEIANQGPMWPTVIEQALDRLTYICQRITDMVSRSLRTSPTDSAPLNALPDAAARANSVLGFDQNGQPYAATGVSGAAVASTWVVANWFPVASPAAGRAVLGFPLPLSELNSPYELSRFGDVTDPVGFSEALLAAALYVSSHGGGIVHIPGGTWSMGVPSANEVNPDEGAAVILTSAIDRVVFLGDSRTTRLVPVSNKVELFAIDGATNTVFAGIHFDNSSHGALSGTLVTPGTPKAPGSGVAGLGNGANGAINQYTGASVKVFDCEFSDWHTCVGYKGNWLDIAQLVGTVDVQHCRFLRCVMGLLPSQPEYVVCSHNRWLDGNDSISGGSGVVAPGHLLYISNRPGAHPYVVTANDNYARHHSSSVLKLRKGRVQICTGNVFDDVHRGIESHNARVSTVTGNTIKLTKWPVNRIPRGYTGGSPNGIDDNQSGIEVTGFVGGGTIADNTIDKSGSYGYGMRIRAYDLAEDGDGEVGEEQFPRNLSITNNKVVDDCSSAMIQYEPVVPGDPLPPMVLAPMRPWFSIFALSDAIVSGNTLHIIEDVDTTEYMISADNCERVKFFNNERFNKFSSAGSELLVHLRSSACVDCMIAYKATDIPVAINAVTTIQDHGTGTRQWRTDGTPV